VLRYQICGSKFRGRLGPAIVNGYFNQKVLLICFRVFDEHIKISVVIKNAGVDQFKFVSNFPLRLFSSTNQAYGYSRCGYLYSIFMYECEGVLSR
jgi:hypothetical protein